MDQSSPRDPYRIAFEQAKSLFNQLTFELDALDRRHAALLSATKALETMIEVRGGEKPAPNQAAATALGHRSSGVPAQTPQLTDEPLNRAYIHRELPNAIQHRIDLALGQM